jgi:hypothetical protein
LNKFISLLFKFLCIHPKDDPDNGQISVIMPFL